MSQSMKLVLALFWASLRAALSTINYSPFR
jgi:hypothetical protein